MNESQENKQDAEQAALAKAIKFAKEAYNPLLAKELYTQLALEHKTVYDCYRKAGFNMQEALRLTVKYYD